MTPNLQKLLELGYLQSTCAIEAELWSSWVHELERVFSEPAPLTLRVQNLDRKWELVSAYQKTVRRGDTELALRLVSAMVSLTSERQYCWRRIVTTAAEDIGAGNPLAMKFVIACSLVWTPSMLDERSAMALWSMLTSLMCESGKSRMYCQFSIMENAIKDKELIYKTFDQSAYGQEIKKILTTDLKACTALQDKWLLSHNWRAEGMAVGPIWTSMLQPKLIKTEEVLTKSVLLKGLPDYAYDMHTRVGKGALYRACGVMEIRQFFVKNVPISKPDALGWAVFFEEGGKIKERQMDVELDRLEHQVVAERHGYGLLQWLELRLLVKEIINSGKLNEMRSELLEKAYG